MWWLLLLIPAAVLALVAVVLVRTAMFVPHDSAALLEGDEQFDGERAVANLQELIRCRTISYNDHALEDDAEFEKLIGLLPKLYPNVFKACTMTRLPDRALLFKWQGKNDGEPAVMMSHYDVVPVNEEQWTHEPFAAEVVGGVLYGRGAVDTKATFNGVLSAADELISRGFVPENSMYFAFSGGEEINGPGASHIVDFFEQNGITPALVVDEGGAVVENVFPGVKAACGLIGIAEKGATNIKYTAKSAGGHASAPKPKTPVDTLSRACVKIVDNPFKAHLTAPVAEMFDTLGRHSTFVYRMIFANLWLFMPVLDMICKKSGGDLNALMRTTVAFTTMSGSNAYNVIPPEAHIVSNIRLNPNDTLDSAQEYLKRTIGDDKVELEMLFGINPSRISTTACEGYEKVKLAVASTWKGCLVSPYLMVQASDSRHYGRISDKVYRFSAMDLTNDERAGVHGNDEHVRVSAVKKAVEFYIRLMKQC